MRILLAEDERELSNALCAILKHNNYSVDAVYNGRDALDYLKCGNYDLAILDIMMPVLDGLSALRSARESGVHIPVLMLTAKAELDDRVLGLDSGADDYLTKPFEVRELLARLRALTRRPAETGSALMTFGNITLDRASYELSTPAGAFRLANREYQMMEMFIMHPGQLISGERFMEKIWGCDSDAEINVVWVYISNLRKRLSSLSADVNIKAVRNSGYTLEKNI